MNHGRVWRAAKGVDPCRRHRSSKRSVSTPESTPDMADIVQSIRPYVDEIHKQYVLHIDVGLIQNNNIYPVYRRESKDTLAFLHFTTAGDLHNLATGKAAMAFMDDAQLTGFLDRPGLQPEHDRSTIDRRKIEQELQETRDRGYSLNKETFLPGLIAIGARIFNLRTGKVIGG